MCLHKDEAQGPGLPMAVAEAELLLEAQREALGHDEEVTLTTASRLAHWLTVRLPADGVQLRTLWGHGSNSCMSRRVLDALLDSAQSRIVKQMALAV